MIGIIVAENEELNALTSIIDIKEEKIINNRKLILGKINKIEVCVIKSNVGKVNSAITTQFLIDKINPRLIINIGVAGSIDNTLNIGDIVIADKLYQYDFDTTAFNRKLGEIENIGEYITSNIDKQLFEDCRIGSIATGDKFITDYSEKNKIRQTFGALCVEMEGASVAQTCYLNNKPFIVIRSISDKLDGSSKIEFEKFIKLSSEKVVNLLKTIIDKL